MAQESRLAVTIDSRGARQQADFLSSKLKYLQERGDDAAESVYGIGAAAKAAAAAMASIGVGQLTRTLLQTTDRFKAMTGQINLVSSSTAEASRTFETLKGMANETGASLESTVTLFTRMSNATKGAGFSQAQLLKATDAVNKAFLVSSATQEEATAASIQLSQAMASGTLRGEELNSVMEQAPRITRALSEYLGVTNGQIRSMAAEGKITSEVVMNALLASLSSLNKEVASMPPLFERASQVVKNNFLAAIGQVNVDPAIKAMTSLGDVFASPETVAGIEKISNALSGVANFGVRGFEGLISNMDALIALSGAYAASVGVRMTASLTSSTQARLADVSASMQQVTAAREIATADAQAAQISTRRAAAEKQLAGAKLARANVELQAARGTNAETIALQAQVAAASENRAATIALTQAKAAQTAAEANLTAAATRGAAARSAAMAAFGGPVGLATLAVSALAGGMLYLGSGTDTATKALIDQNLTLDDSIDKFRTLTAEQKRFQSATWMQAQRDAAEEASAALDTYFNRAFEGLTSIGSSGADAVATFRGMFKEVKDGRRSLDSLTTWITSNTAVSGTYQAELVKVAAAYADSTNRAAEYEKLLGRSKSASVAATAATDSLSRAQGAAAASLGGGAKEWEKYIDQLTQTRDLIGANAAQEAAYSAAKAGFNAQQIEYARRIGEQTDILKKYEQAIQDGKKAEQDRLKAQLTASIAASEAIKSQLETHSQAMNQMADNAESSAKRQITALEQAANFAVMSSSQMVSAAQGSPMSRQGENLLTFGQPRVSPPPAVTAPGKSFAQLAQEAIDQLEGNTTAKTKRGPRGDGLASKLSSAKTAFDDLYKAAQPAKFALQEYVDRQGKLELLLSKGKITQEQYNLALGQSSLNYAAAIKGAQGLTQAEQYRAQMQRQLATQQMEYAAQAQAVGMGQKDAARMQERLQIEQETNNRILQLQTELANAQGEKQRQDLQAQIDLEREYLGKRIAAQREGWAQLDQAQSSWSAGARGAFQDYVDSARDVAGQSRSFFTNAFSSMEDAVANFAISGKLSFSDFTKSILADMARIATRQAATGIFASIAGSAIGSWFGGGANGLASGSAGEVSSRLGASAAGYSPKFGFATGGYTGDGGKFEPKGVVHGGEFVVRKEVVSQPGMRDHLDRLNKKGYASGGMVGSSQQSPAASATYNFPISVQVDSGGQAAANVQSDQTPEQTGRSIQAATQAEVEKAIAAGLRSGGAIWRAINKR